MADFQAFANRLNKNARHWEKWARRQGVSCYRVYDRDIPEFPVAVDLYGQHVHLQEFDTGYQMTDEEHAAWVEGVFQAVAEVLQLPRGVLDVQRDHPLLINHCLKLLGQGGELFFSNNLRSFRLAPDQLYPCKVLDISAQTVPEDFRNKKIHQCWLIAK